LLPLPPHDVQPRSRRATSARVNCPAPRRRCSRVYFARGRLDRALRDTRDHLAVPITGAERVRPKTAARSVMDELLRRSRTSRSLEHDSRSASSSRTAREDHVVITSSASRRARPDAREDDGVLAQVAAFNSPRARRRALRSRCVYLLDLEQKCSMKCETRLGVGLVARAGAISSRSQRTDVVEPS